jgi:hypothetical protein
MKLIRPVRRDDEHAERLGTMRKMMQQLERSLICPMNILENEEHWLVGGKSFEHGEDQFERSFLLPLRITFGSASLPCFQLREDRREHCAQWTKNLRDCFSFSLLDPEPKGVHERRVGDRRFGARAASFDHPDLPRRHVVFEIANEAALSDSRVASDEHNTAGAADCTVESLDQCLKGLVAAN